MPTGAFSNLAAMGCRHPFHELNLLKRQVGRLADALFYRMPLGRFITSGVFPSINLTEDAGHFYIRAELPGMAPGDIDVQLDGRNLTLTGERKIAAEGRHVHYHRREREAGRFSRVIGLPGDIDGDRATARLVNGLMTITLAKAAPPGSKRFTVG